MELIKVEFVDRIEYKNELGQRHNEDGPAIEGYNGYKEWWINGQRHREDGPAVQYYNGEKLWYLNGQNYSEDEWKQEVAKIKINDANISKIIEKIAEEYAKQFDYAEESSPQLDFIEGAKAVLNLIKNNSINIL
jgi:hypothetical protein